MLKQLFDAWEKKEKHDFGEFRSLWKELKWFQVHDLWKSCSYEYNKSFLYTQRVYFLRERQQNEYYKCLCYFLTTKSDVLKCGSIFHLYLLIMTQHLRPFEKVKIPYWVFQCFENFLQDDSNKQAVRDAHNIFQYLKNKGIFIIEGYTLYDYNKFKPIDASNFPIELLYPKSNPETEASNSHGQDCTAYPDETLKTRVAEVFCSNEEF